jgi:hypothetical protein
VPIGGGALAGKDPHKVDKCGALRSRQLAKKLVRGGVDEARVVLGWTPGDDAPFLVEASTTEGNVNLQVPRGELPRQEWFTIKAIVRDLELTERDWAADLRGGSLGAMRTAAIMKSQTPFPVPPYLIATRSYNLRRILIALGAVIAEMTFPGQAGMDISTNDRHLRVRLHVHSLPALILFVVAENTLFPDPADRFLDVCDADGCCDLGLGRAPSPAVELETRLQFARDEAG